MALNNVVIMGRITHDLELKTTASGISVVSFAVAVERSYCKQGEEREVDFVECVAWKERAEFISKYFGKGRMIAVTGELRTRVYEDKNGAKHKATEVYVNNASFTGEKPKDKTQPAADQSAAPPAPPTSDFGAAGAEDYPF